MDETDALRMVRSKVHQVCDATGVSRAPVEIVEKLQGKKGSDFTAQVRARKGRPLIEVPLRVAREYPDEALTWLLAHEVSHYKRYEGRRSKDRLFNAGLLGFGALLAAGTSWLVVTTFVSAEDPPGGILVVIGMFLYTGYLALVLADSRAEEREADRFAIRYVGTLDGALQWASLTPHSRIPAERRGVRRLGALFDPFNRWAGLVFNTHPYVPMRIDAMRAELERGDAEKNIPRG
jgi:Zn-dependent protease with chaperone function